MAENGQDVIFVDPTDLARLQVNTLDFASSDPLGHWKEAETQLKPKVNDYEPLRMQRTVMNGENAAVWEFTFQGSARQFRATELGFGKAGGTEYALYLSAPSEQWTEYKPVFETAVEGFRIPD